MKILILNGNPYFDDPTSDMARALMGCAKEAGYEMVSIHDSHKNILGGDKI